MKERPILFSGPMVRAILEGRKTQTRRVVSCQPPDDGDSVVVGSFHPAVVDRHGDEQPGEKIFGAYTLDGSWGIKCSYGQPGDRLWVREAAMIAPPNFGDCANGGVLDSMGRKRIVQYIASHPDVEAGRDYGLKITPSIHMPRWASRITLEVTGVRVERVQAITMEGAFAEGLQHGEPMTEMDIELMRGTEEGELAKAFGVGSRSTALFNFICLWDELNEKRGYSWHSNPLVWVVEFKKLEKNEEVACGVAA